MGIKIMIKRKQSALENMIVSPLQFLLLINGFEANEIYNLADGEYPKTIDNQLKSEIEYAVSQLHAELESGLLKCKTSDKSFLFKQNSSYRFKELLSAFCNDYDFDWSNSPSQIKLLVENLNRINSEGFSFDLFERIKTTLGIASLKYTLDCPVRTLRENPFTWSYMAQENLKELKDTASAELMSLNFDLSQKIITLKKEKVHIENERKDLLNKCVLLEADKNKTNDSNSLKVIGALIALIEQETIKKFNQSRVIATLAETKQRGFSESSLQKLFAKSKKAFEESNQEN